ncbi:MAG: glycosyltransferase [Clostridium paraputrificum]
MRIAMLTNNYKPFVGGVPISIERLSKSLRSLGHEVYIFAPTYDNQCDEKFVIRYKSLKGKISGGVVLPNIFDIEIEKKFKALKFDIIHVHHPMLLGNIAQYLGKKYNIPVVYTYHTRYEEYLHFLKPFKLLESRGDKVGEKILNYSKEKFVPNRIRNFVNRCDLVFAPTETMKEYLLQRGAESKVKVLPTGLEDEYFNENKEGSREVRNKYIRDNKYLFCTVSRLSKEKNLHFFIDGLLELKNKIGDCFNTMVIGDGPLKKELEERVQRLGLHNNITFIGKVDNKKIKEYYGACDLFLFSSKSETQGIVILEAMASKIPVVAVKASGVMDVVENGVNGYMTTGNEEDWANRIWDIIMNNNLRLKLKDGAFRTSKEYSDSKVAKLALHYYEEVILECYRRGQEYALKMG